MNENLTAQEREALEAEGPLERHEYDFALTRREFVQVLGAGLLITASAAPVAAQRRGDAAADKSAAWPPAFTWARTARSPS